MGVWAFGIWAEGIWASATSPIYDSFEERNLVTRKTSRKRQRLRSWTLQALIEFLKFKVNL